MYINNKIYVFMESLSIFILYSILLELYLYEFNSVFIFRNNGNNNIHLNIIRFNNYSDI